FAPGDDRLAIATPDGPILHDIARGASRVLAGPAATAALAFSPDGRLLALIRRGARSVELWETSDVRKLTEFRWGVGELASAAFAPDGLTAAAGAESGAVVLWDLDAG